MKKVSLIISLAVLLIVTGCDKVKELIDMQEIDVDTSFVVSFPFGISAMPNPATPVNFGRSMGYDILSNPDVADRIGSPDQIKKVVINSIQYEYRNFTGNVDANLSGQFVFEPGPQGNNFFMTETVNLANSDLLGTIYTLQGNFEDISERISQDRSVFFTSSGTSTHNPAGWIIDVIFTATVTVELNADDL